MDVFNLSVMGQGRPTCSCYPGGICGRQNKIPAFFYFFSSDNCMPSIGIYAEKYFYINHVGTIDRASLCCIDLQSTVGLMTNDRSICRRN